jgi:hypothetical protein
MKKLLMLVALVGLSLSTIGCADTTAPAPVTPPADKAAPAPDAAPAPEGTTPAPAPEEKK